MRIVQLKFWKNNLMVFSFLLKILQRAALWQHYLQKRNSLTVSLGGKLRNSLLCFLFKKCSNLLLVSYRIKAEYFMLIGCRNIGIKYVAGFPLLFCLNSCYLSDLVEALSRQFLKILNLIYWLLQLKELEYYYMSLFRI